MPRLGVIRRRLKRTSASRRVVAAVPIRPRAAGGVEFLLVRTRDGERWTFPKGGCEAGETLSQAAAREAAEEAGAVGRVGSEPIAEYVYGEDVVTAFVLGVNRIHKPAERGRDPSWFGFEAARSKLGEGRPRPFGADMERVLLAAQRGVGAVT
jgi:8-oxo-dGTP pyrophosphatase MutT (NUDIX family)